VKVPLSEAGAFSVRSDYTFFQDSQPIFAGNLRQIEIDIAGETATLDFVGLFKRLDQIVPVTPPADRIAFGVPAPDNAIFPQFFLPTVTTVRQVIETIYQLVILPATGLQLVASWSPVSCKLSGEFSLYANDELSRVLETLAMMDDLVCGVSANRELYFIHRPAITDAFDVVVDPQTFPATTAVFLEGQARIKQSAPTQVAVYSRDAQGQQAIRVYRDIGATSPNRRVSQQARNIRSGPQARRLARGILRRYANLPLEFTGAKFYLGSTRRIEPHLGKFRVIDPQVTQEGLVGSLAIEWLPAIVASFQLNESDADPGGNGPNDPFTTEPPPDDPAVNTGTGTQDLPDPSSQINLDDGFDGDGDGFHFDGVRTVDYGSDLADATNRPAVESTQAGAFGLYSLLWPGEITALDFTGPDPSYTVTLFRADGQPCSLPGNTESGDQGVFDGCLAFPEPFVPYPVGSFVWCAFVLLDGGEPTGLASQNSPILSQQVFANGLPLPGVLVRFRELAGGRKVFVLTDSQGFARAKVNPGFVQVSVVQWPYQDPLPLFSNTVNAQSDQTLTSITVSVPADNLSRAVTRNDFNASPVIVALSQQSVGLGEYPLGRMLHGPAELFGGVRD
jgi:hypothetical protein